MSKVALAQINPHVGSLDENVDKITAYVQRAREMGADLVLFPELAITGYPPEDLLLRPGFLQRVDQALEQLLPASQGIIVVVGHPIQGNDGALYNAASALLDGEIICRYYKQELPNYGVFDEMRYFRAGSEPALIKLDGEQMALTVCEDLWHPHVMQQVKDAGATMVLNLNASPFHAGKRGVREQLIRNHAHNHNVPILYVNQVGGQDELIFDGGSFVVDANGEQQLCGDYFEEGLYLYDSGEVQRCVIAHTPSREEEIYRALVLATRDYVRKNGFLGVIIGLSGGIDSALTLAIAVDALGADQVEGVSMPSRYTADMSVEDARIEAERLGVRFRVISIRQSFEAFLDTLSEEFAGTAADATEENIQARCRGVILMAIANKRNRMLLTTGNKSEMSVGYATLYGDMAGGFAPLKDLSKLMVYRLAQWRNRKAEEEGEPEVIPQRVIERPPSAELAPDQKDSDTLPPYEILDPILERYIEQDQCAEEIIQAGFDESVVTRVVGMVDGNEYKRRQAPPGARITTRAFGRERRYPITSGFRSR